MIEILLLLLLYEKTVVLKECFFCFFPQLLPRILALCALKQYRVSVNKLREYIVTVMLESVIL